MLFNIGKNLRKLIVLQSRFNNTKYTVLFRKLCRFSRLYFVSCNALNMTHKLKEPPVWSSSFSL